MVLCTATLEEALNNIFKVDPCSWASSPVRNRRLTQQMSCCECSRVNWFNQPAHPCPEYCYLQLNSNKYDLGIKLIKVQSKLWPFALIERSIENESGCDQFVFNSNFISPNLICPAPGPGWRALILSGSHLGQWWGPGSGDTISHYQELSRHRVRGEMNGQHKLIPTPGQWLSLLDI